MNKSAVVDGCKGHASVVVIETWAGARLIELGLSECAKRAASTCFWRKCGCSWQPLLGCLSTQAHPAWGSCSALRIPLSAPPGWLPWQHKVWSL